MFTREITGIFILFFLLILVFLAPPLIFKMSLLIIFGFALAELYFLIEKPYWPSIIVFIFLAGSLFLLSSFEQNRSLFLYAIFISAINDSAAFYVGKKYGSRKIFPDTSPNKTLEGLLAGIFISSSLLFLIAYLKVFNFDKIFFMNSGMSLFAILLICSIFAVIGDYLESKIKRIAKVKDSGSLLPGHGGMLDRVDSHIFVIPLFFIISGATL